jgi:hypothetical protein
MYCIEPRPHSIETVLLRKRSQQRHPYQSYKGTKTGIQDLVHEFLIDASENRGVLCCKATKEGMIESIETLRKHPMNAFDETKTIPI